MLTVIQIGGQRSGGHRHAPVCHLFFLARSSAYRRVVVMFRCSRCNVEERSEIEGQQAEGKRAAFRADAAFAKAEIYRRARAVAWSMPSASGRTSRRAAVGDMLRRIWARPMPAG